jgi:hypothetical protein
VLQAQAEAVADRSHFLACRGAVARRADRPQRRAAARPSIVEASSREEGDSSELEAMSEPESEGRTPGPSDRPHADTARSPGWVVFGVHISVLLHGALSCVQDAQEHG